MTGPSLLNLPCACATVRQLSRTITRLYDDRLRRAGLEATQFTLLMTLEQKGATSQVELCRLFALDKTTISRNLKVLERNGWLTSSTPGDKRVRQFTLTAAGRATLAAAKPHWKKVQDDLRAQMTADQWTNLFATVRATTGLVQSLMP